jgi:hypothetical protein
MMGKGMDTKLIVRYAIRETLEIVVISLAKTNSRRKDGSLSILHVSQLRNTADPAMVATGGLEPPT